MATGKTQERSPPRPRAPTPARGNRQPCLRQQRVPASGGGSADARYGKQRVQRAARPSRSQGAAGLPAQTKPAASKPQAGRARVSFGTARCSPSRSSVVPQPSAARFQAERRSDCVRTRCSCSAERALVALRSQRTGPVPDIPPDAGRCGDALAEPGPPRPHSPAADRPRCTELRGRSAAAAKRQHDMAPLIAPLPARPRAAPVAPTAHARPLASRLLIGCRVPRLPPIRARARPLCAVVSMVPPPLCCGLLSASRGRSAALLLPLGPVAACCSPRPSSTLTGRLTSGTSTLLCWPTRCTANAASGAPGRAAFQQVSVGARGLRRPSSASVGPGPGPRGLWWLSLCPGLLFKFRLDTGKKMILRKSDDAAAQLHKEVGGQQTRRCSRSVGMWH